jgi:predicted enzyme related to lactoylglutathione lyase
MSRSDNHPPHGQIGYLQIPATDIEASCAFYRAVFGWDADPTWAGFTAPGMIGQFVTDRAPTASDGPMLWIAVQRLNSALDSAVEHGGTVAKAPQLDQGERWLAEIDDVAGNRIGLFAAAHTAKPQTLLAVGDVEASSRWYQTLLGLRSDHGGPNYERLLSDDELILQLHSFEVEHGHGRIGDPAAPLGNGVLVWFGEVADFDDVVRRATELDAPVVLAPHRNPPAGEGNGPGHREVWITDPDGYTVVIASPDGEAYEAR